MAISMSLSEMNSQNTQKLFFSGEDYAWQYQFAKDHGVQVAYLFYQKQFVNPDGLTFNKTLMENSVNKLIPDINEYGYAVLDWEGPIFHALAGWVTVTPTVYQQYINQFIATIQYAKYLRPNIKWSFYNMPSFLYTRFSEEKTNAYHLKRLPLFKALDFLAPSFYLFFDGKTVEEEFVSQWFDDNLKYSLQLGLSLNKPTYCFVWNRWYPNYPNGNMLMDYTTYKKYISRIVNTQFLNSKPAGLIWWNCEEYLYSLRNSDPIIMNEYKNVTNPTTYKYNILQTYLDSTRAVMNQ